MCAFIMQTVPNFTQIPPSKFADVTKEIRATLVIQYRMRPTILSRVAVFVLLSLSMAGCAKTPNSSASGTSRLLDVTMTLRGAINPNYYYFALINRTDTYSDAGPVPVVGLPWGNGFAAASQNNAQGFVATVVYSGILGGQTGYGVYEVPTDPNTKAPLAKPYEIGAGLSGFTALGLPDQSTAPQTGERILHFRIDLARLPNPNARYLQLNLLATNNLPASSDASAPKNWDALGDGTNSGDLNNYITLDVTQNQRVDNSSGSEPANDVRDHLGPIVDDPSLDITDYSVQILSN